MQRLCVAYNFGCRALYNLPWKASVTGVFRKASQSLVRPWALILGGRLYGANICVEYDRTGICACHLPHYVRGNIVLSLNTICSCHLTPVVGKRFVKLRVAKQMRTLNLTMQ